MQTRTSKNEVTVINHTHHHELLLGSVLVVKRGLWKSHDIGDALRCTRVEFHGVLVALRHYTEKPEAGSGSLSRINNENHACELEEGREMHEDDNTMEIVD